jgi:uncharacterized iron-regulated membrane protein/flavodoxin
MSLHKVIFWSHLVAGVVGGAIIFIMSATGVILMYEQQMVEWAERHVRWVSLPGANSQRKNVDDIVAGARTENRGSRPTGVVLRNDPAAAVAVVFGRDGVTYVDPYTGNVLGKSSKLHDWFQNVINWHRWLAMEGQGRATGRAITGACNLAFFWLAVSGVYLWWPRSWHWRGLKPSLVFNPRLRGKARDWNWHNVIGFWSSAVLMMVTLTAAVMSYQWANDLLYTLTGSEPPPRSESPMAQAQQRPEGGPAKNASRGKALASMDSLLARAEQQAPGWIMMTMRLPPDSNGPLTVLIEEPQAPHIFARSQLVLNRATTEIIKWEPYAAATVGRKLRIWVRGLHTGEALGFIGQTVAGLASLGGCFLVWTGFAMAWRRFRYRKREAAEVRFGEPAPAQIEVNPAVGEPVPQINESSTEVAKLEMEQIDSATSNGHSYQAKQGALAAWATPPYYRDSVVLLYGTVTGTAESLAHKLAAALRAAGVTVRVRDMAHCQPQVLTQASCVLLVVSTYGDGEPPDDAVPFWKAVVHGNGFDLRGLKYSVLALGNTTYDHFCQCGRDFDAALERHGACRIYPRVDCDVDYELPAKHWLSGVLAQLVQNERGSLSAHA